MNIYVLYSRRQPCCVEMKIKGWQPLQLTYDEFPLSSLDILKIRKFFFRHLLFIFFDHFLHPLILEKNFVIKLKCRLDFNILLLLPLILDILFSPFWRYMSSENFCKFHCKIFFRFKTKYLLCTEVMLTHWLTIG